MTHEESFQPLESRGVNDFDMWWVRVHVAGLCSANCDVANDCKTDSCSMPSVCLTKNWHVHRCVFSYVCACVSKLCSRLCSLNGPWPTLWHSASSALPHRCSMSSDLKLRPSAVCHRGAQSVGASKENVCVCVWERMQLCKKGRSPTQCANA